VDEPVNLCQTRYAKMKQKVSKHEISLELHLDYNSKQSCVCAYLIDSLSQHLAHKLEQQQVVLLDVGRGRGIQLLLTGHLNTQQTRHVHHVQYTLTGHLDRQQTRHVHHVRYTLITGHLNTQQTRHG
jgi:hypothetical protein